MWKWIVVIASLCCLGSPGQVRTGSLERKRRGHTRTPATPAAPPTRAAHFTPLLKQHEDQFAHKVISRALDQSADGNRFLDTLIFALVAAQAAIFAIILDKIREYPPAGWIPMLVGFGLSLGGAGLSVFVGDGPDPNEFAANL